MAVNVWRIRSAEILMRQPLGDTMNDRLLQRVVVQDGGVEEGGEHRVFRNGNLRLRPDRHPDRVDSLHGLGARR
jgi:hypothetical protein